MPEPLMRINITDRSAYKYLMSIADDQLPFAVALMLTNLAKGAQSRIRSRMPGQFHLRNDWETKGVRVDNAKKQDWIQTKRATAAVHHLDTYMVRQEEGGDHTPERSRLLAIPTTEYEDQGIRGAGGGILKRYLPSELLHPGTSKSRRRAGRGIMSDTLAKPTPFVMKARSGHILIAIREGADRYPLKFLYSLKDRARVKPRFQFQEQVQQQVDSNIDREFDAAMDIALASRRV